MNKLYLVADFETVVYDGQEETEVWSFTIKHMFTGQRVVFNNINDGMDYIIGLKQNVVCFFHNLKFDGSFILHYLLKNKKYKHGIYKDGTLKKEKNLTTNEFIYLVSNRGQFYNIVIRKNKYTVRFQDSVKLLPFSLQQIGDEFCTKYKKLEMEYKGKRHSYGEITDDEMKYILADVDVLAEAMEIMQNEGHTKSTIGACCMSEFKESLLMGKEDFKRFFPSLKNVILYTDKNGKKVNAHEYCRNAYKGAWCYLVKGKEGKVYKKGLTADVNSLYPFVMGANPYPIGIPWYIDNYKQFMEEVNKGCYYYFVRFKCKFIIKEGYLPFIQIKNTLKYKSNEMLEKSSVEIDGEVEDEPLELTMTMTDFIRFKEFYSLTYFEFLDSIFFYQESGLFDNYINKYREIKENSKGAKRILAKLFLNNLYGKFATDDDSSYKTAYLDDDILKWHTVFENDKDVVYMAVGAAITSFAKDYTIRHAQANYHGVDNPGFIYADTDSCHMDLDESDLVGFDIHPTRFGAWDLESHWDNAIFVRQKTYLEHDVQYGWKVTCAGMPDNCKKEFIKKLESGEKNITDFTHGLKIDGKLSFKQIKGGPILYDNTFTLK